MAAKAETRDLRSATRDNTATSSSSTSSLSSATFTTPPVPTPAPAAPMLSDKSRIALQIVLVILALFAARVALSALGIFQLLIPFFFGFLFACLALPPAAYVIYKKVFETKPVNRGEFNILPAGELADQLKFAPFPGERWRYPKTLEERINEDGEMKSVTWGDLYVQFQGKVSDRVLCYCVLKGESLFFQNTKAKGRSGEVKSMLLTGSYVRLVDESSAEGYKYALELIHPDRCLIFKVDYIYLVAQDDKNIQRWYYALRSICKPWEEVHTNINLIKENPTVKNFEKIWSEFSTLNKFNQTENGDFLNIFLARLWLVLRDSPEIKYKLLDLLQVKLSLALEDYQGYFSDVAIKTIDLGSTPPRLQAIRVNAPRDVKSASDPLHDLVLELGLNYTEGTVKIAFGTKVSFGPASTEINVTIHVKQVIGRVMLIIPPYPHGRLALSFVDVPDLVIDLELGVGKTGGSLSALPSKVQKFIYKKIKGAFNEGFVWPNREYINLPFIPNSDPARPVTKMEVRNEAVSLETLGVGIVGPIPVPSSPRGEKKRDKEDEKEKEKEREKEKKDEKENNKYGPVSPRGGRGRANTGVHDNTNSLGSDNNPNPNTARVAFAPPVDIPPGGLQGSTNAQGFGSPRRGMSLNLNSAAFSASGTSTQPNNTTNSSNNVGSDGVMYSPRRGAFVNVDEILNEDGEMIKTSRAMADLKKDHQKDAKEKEKEREKEEKKQRKEFEKSEKERKEQEKKEQKKKEKEAEKKRKTLKDGGESSEGSEDLETLNQSADKIEGGDMMKDSTSTKDKFKFMAAFLKKRGTKDTDKAAKAYADSVAQAEDGTDDPDFERGRRKSKVLRPPEYSSAPVPATSTPASADLAHHASEPLPEGKKGTNSSESASTASDLPQTAASPRTGLVSPRSRPVVPTLKLGDKPAAPAISTSTATSESSIPKLNTEGSEPGSEVKKSDSKGHRHSRSYDNRSTSTKDLDSISEKEKRKRLESKSHKSSTSSKKDKKDKKDPLDSSENKSDVSEKSEK